jgi:glucosamine kinase
MLLIADSGSTKTDWRLVTETGKTITTIVTEGLNPYFLTKEKISSIIQQKVLPTIDGVDKVFFYGAGCGLFVKAAVVKEALDETIQAKYPAEVNGDILGAARSLLLETEGVACILGTGANSCLYNGREITNIMPSLGYMFSDWGSGTVMSKDFISLILQEKLPRTILDDFRDTYQLERAQILDSIYNKPLPNRFLASFTPFLLKYSVVPELRTIISDNFSKFFDYYVLPFYKNKSQLKVSFTGSIAHSFRTYLQDAAEEVGISIEQIVQHPMDGLVRYHCTTVSVNNT